MFELKPTPDKGIGAFAIQDIPAGTSFHREIPIMIFTMKDHFISERDVVDKYNKLTDTDKIIFDQARHDTSHPPHCTCKKGVASANSFRNPPRIYPIGSRFNHSCDPNMMMLAPVEGIYQTFRTLKQVSAGEELCFNYSAIKLTYLPTAERKVQMRKEIFHFDCLCSFCHRPAADILASDMRRKLLLQLDFWLRVKGTFAENFATRAHRSAEMDLKLKRRGVYALLFAMLHEAEGIVIGPDAYASYGNIARHVLNTAYHKKILRISPRVVQEMRLWMRKAEDNVMLQYGDPTEGDELLSIKEAMSPVLVQDDGTLNWPGLLKVAAACSKTSPQLFSSAPPLCL